MSGRHDGLRRRAVDTVLVLMISTTAGVAACTGTAAPDPGASATSGASPQASATGTAPTTADPPLPEPLTERELGPVPDGFGSWTEVFEVQQRLNVAADRISEAAGAASGLVRTSSGLAGIVAAPQSRRLVVYWKGSLPQEVSDLIDQIRAELPVDVQAARYSAAQLGDASRLVATQRGVAMVAANVDGSAVTATIYGPVDVASWRVDVPVTIRRGERPFPIACSRQNDCPPWWGGATYWSSTGICNMGLAVLKNGVRFMLSAAHCTAGAGDPITTPNGSVIGFVESVNNNRDIMLIRHTLATEFQGVIYSGTTNALSGYHRRIRSAVGSAVGNYVCASASGTGEHCSMKVVATNVWFASATGGAPYGPFVQADHIKGGVATGTSDSGGPVHFGLWYILAGNFHATTALGTMSFGQNVVACPAGVPATTCGSTLLYADIKSSLAYYQASIITEGKDAVTKK